MDNNKNLEFDDDSIEENWDNTDIIDSDSVENLNNSSDSEDDLGADKDGVFVNLVESTADEPEIDDSELDTYFMSAAHNDFIDDTGNIVVMDKNNQNDGKCFESKDIQLDRITLAADRIRATGSYETIYQSIKNTGLLEPIIVAPTMTEGYYVLLHGFRRLQACAKLGFKTIPCIINHRVKTAEIPILEALYNHNAVYKMKEIVKYIDYLQKEKNILNASLIEYLCQLNNGDYNKICDMREDDDPDIWGKVIEDQLTIANGFKALEKRRAKETKEEQEIKTSEKVHDDNSENNEMNNITGSGETTDGSETLSDEEVEKLMIDPASLNDDIEDSDLDAMVAEGKKMDGFEGHQQDYKQRERIDPAIRKAVMSRDNNTCQCCKRGGPDYVDILDLHHIVEVYLGGRDTVDNGITVCLNCHKQIHLYAMGQLYIPKEKTEAEIESDVAQKILARNSEREAANLAALSKDDEEEIRSNYVTIYNEERNKYKRIVKLGNIIRKGIQQRGLKVENVKREHPIYNIGRQKPGEKNVIG